MAEALSNAQALFQHIRDQPDRLAYLSSLHDRTCPHYPFFEEEWLDFKSCPTDRNAPKSIDEKSARKIWSKALSGFANITDGVIIWGIDARKTPPRDIDAACGLAMVPDPAAFESKLRNWIRDATNPPVTCVEYLSVANPSGEGFVVCLIPESAHKPHRAEFADKNYYYRAGDDFLIAEPGLLRTLFYPRNQPRLMAGAVLKSEGTVLMVDGAITFDLVIKIIILNIGNYSATNVCVVVEHDKADEPESVAGAAWDFIGLRPERPLGRFGQMSLHTIAFASERPLPPGFNSLAGSLKWKRIKTTNHLIAFGSDKYDPSLVQDRIAVTLSVYGDAIGPTKCSVKFEGDDLGFTGEPVTKLFTVMN